MNRKVIEGKEKGFKKKGNYREKKKGKGNRKER